MALTEQQIQEIKEQQSQENSTKRVTSPELEKILYEAIPILDHGFIRVIDYMGDDGSIVQQSTSHSCHFPTEAREREEKKQAEMASKGQKPTPKKKKKKKKITTTLVEIT